MIKKTLLFIGLLSMVGCGTSFVRNAYIIPKGSCGYAVNIVALGSFGDTTLSRCMPLEDAKSLAEQINKDMAGKWSGTTTVE